MENLNLITNLGLQGIDVEAIVVDDLSASITSGSDRFDGIIILQCKEQIRLLLERPNAFWQVGTIHGSMVSEILDQFWVEFDGVQVSAVGDEKKRALMVGADHFWKIVLLE